MLHNLRQVVVAFLRIIGAFLNYQKTTESIKVKKQYAF